MSNVFPLNPKPTAIWGNLNLNFPVTVVISQDAEDREFLAYIDVFNEKLAAFQLIDNWHLDGILIVPVEYIISVEHKDNPLDFLRILEFHKAVKRPSCDWLDLSNFGTFFSSLKEREVPIGLEDNESLEIGIVTKVNAESVIMNGMDQLGEWLIDEVERVYKDIFVVTIDDEYSSGIFAYAKMKTSL